MKRTLLINGEWLEGGGRDNRPVFNPATGTVIGSVPVATQADIDRAAEVAHDGFEQWRGRTALERGNILSSVAVAMRAQCAQLAALLTLEQGKTIKEATAEVMSSAELVQWLAEEGKRVYGRIVPARNHGMEQLVYLEPVGPVAAFSPWNYPVTLATRKIGHALAAGCSIVIKPAEECPSAVLALAKIFLDCGVPAAALQVLFGNPAEISERLIASPFIRKVSFTGSIAVGRHLGGLAGAALKKVTFELGGHAPVIVMNDAHVDKFVEAAVLSKFRNAGQICISPTRFFVHDGVYDEIVGKFARRASLLQVGDGMQATTDMGPLAHDRRPEVMASLTEDAVKHGARILTGGPAAKSPAGFFWNPTVLSDVTPSARIMREEPFGPMASFTRFDDLDQAVAQANSLSYGLAGYGFTSSLASARRIQEGLKVGMVSLNTFTATVPEMPFSGVRDSGLGAAMGTEGLMDHLTLKSVFRAD
jgi:succinate-semialdehyde dehydrogenase/glutarate-semialdehyde dehydrogenase